MKCNPSTRFGAELRAEREAQGFTQDDLAGMVGVKGTAISRWELGRSHPSQTYLTRLCKALCVSYSFFGLEALEFLEVGEKAPALQPMALELPLQPATETQPEAQPLGALPADVQAAIDTILRLSFDAQTTLMSLIAHYVDQKECERRLLIQLGAGGGE